MLHSLSAQTDFHFSVGLDFPNPKNRGERTIGVFWSDAELLSSVALSVNMEVEKQLADKYAASMVLSYLGHIMEGEIPRSAEILDEYGFRRFIISPQITYHVSDKLTFSIGPEVTYLFAHFLRPEGAKRSDKRFDSSGLNNFQLGVRGAIKYSLNQFFVQPYFSQGVLYFDDDLYRNYIKPLDSYGINIGVSF